MTFFDYRQARRLALDDTPFYALIMAAIMRADTANAAKLRAAWPDVWDETQKRYDAPGALLPGESDAAL